MERLLGGSRKEAVLLTATPINNGLWDLYNLVMLFARHDKAFAASGIDSVRDLFLAAGANERDPEVWTPTCSSRSPTRSVSAANRSFIEAEYAGQQFPDGTPARFPRPRLTTRRYDLDAAHPGLLDRIATAIDALTMARYRPSAFDLQAEDELAVEAQLAGLLRSGVLKRFESCWRACLETVERMLVAHEAFLLAWTRGEVPSRATLREAAYVEAGETGLADWVEQALEGDADVRPASDFDPDYGDAVRADRDQLATIQDRLASLNAADDPKLAALVDLLETSPAAKVAVFATFGATVRYLDDHLPALVGGRERVVVIGNESTPDQRTGALSTIAGVPQLRSREFPTLVEACA